jgi:BASS family bile acid:Na+ symporter
MNKVSGVALLIMLVVGLGLNVSSIISLIGSLGFLALILFIMVSLVIRFVMGGRDPAIRSVMGLGTAQRNVAAAILVTTLNFPGTMTSLRAGNIHRLAADLDPDRPPVGQAQLGSGELIVYYNDGE